MTTTYTLSVIRGDAGPDVTGDELGQSALDGVDLDQRVHAWLEACGCDQPGDDLTWVLVTHVDEHPGQLANLVDQRDVDLVDGVGRMVAPGLQGDEEGLDEACRASLAQVVDDPDR